MMDEAIKHDIVNYRRQKAYDLMHDVDVLVVFEDGRTKKNSPKQQ